MPLGQSLSNINLLPTTMPCELDAHAGFAGGVLHVILVLLTDFTSHSQFIVSLTYTNVCRISVAKFIPEIVIRVPP